MEERPKLKLQLTTGDKLLDGLGWLFIAVLWILVFLNYSQLPDSIPIHYNGAGHADNFGRKLSILTLPFIATLVYGGMTFLNKYPHVFNYPVNITADNALAHYTNSTRMIRYIKLVLVFVFGAIVYQTIQTATGKAEGLGIWFVPTTFAMIFIPLTFFLIKAYKIKRTSTN